MTNFQDNLKTQKNDVYWEQLFKKYSGFIHYEVQWMGQIRNLVSLHIEKFISVIELPYRNQVLKRISQ